MSKTSLHMTYRLNKLRGEDLKFSRVSRTTGYVMTDKIDAVNILENGDPIKSSGQ